MLDKDIVVPKSIAIIMDGNGRYAAKKNMPRALGHKAGCDNLEIILEECVRLDVKFLTVYAFSTENWSRSESEINALMELFKLYLPRIKEKAKKNNVRVKFIGMIDKFEKDVYDGCLDLINETKDMTGTTFVIALNYGGRDEIIRAVNKICNDFKNREDLIIDEKSFEQYLDTKDMDNPDLVIRTSGEKRTSNFLLWQSAYSEYYFTDLFWPEFNIEELHKAIIDYNKRERRFGGRK